jgi:uncharacterized membrane protein YqjE
MSRNDGGLVGNMRGLAANGVRAVRTRLELLGVELQIEKARIIRQLVVAVAAFYLLSLGMLTAIFWIVVNLSDEPRRIALGGIALAFLGLGAGALLWLLYGNSRAKPLLATTIAVLKSDEHALAGTKS